MAAYPRHDRGHRSTPGTDTAAQELKRKYDPDNFLRLNQKIRPD